MVLFCSRILGKREGSSLISRFSGESFNWRSLRKSFTYAWNFLFLALFVYSALEFNAVRGSV